MGLRAAELVLVATEANRELAGAVVQKVSAPTATRLYLELRVPGRSVTLHLCGEAGVERLSAVEERPSNPPVPPTWQHVLRAQLIGARLLDVEAVPERRLAVLHFAAPEDGPALALILEVGSEAGVALTTRESRVLCCSRGFRGRLRPGSTWAPPDAVTPSDAPSRLSGDRPFLRLLFAAEALFGALEQERWKRDAAAPMKRALARLERTREKVRADAARASQAETLRKEGELLTQNLGRLERGMRSITVEAYLEDGTVRPVTIALDPKRTPREEVDARFHQYRRLLRGAQLSQNRLRTLDEEEQRLREALASVAEQPPALPAELERSSKKDEPLPPYRHYVGHGHPIWVGRGAAHNDALTFKVARPHHLWLHARGVPGAHVVIPLEKRASPPAEVLVDAAHLALHHSDAKGETRGEVSYTQAKYVRRQGAEAPPGAVTYTHEKTMMVRLEPERLARLLAAEVRPESR